MAKPKKEKSKPSKSKTKAEKGDGGKAADKAVKKKKSERQASIKVDQSAEHPEDEGGRKAGSISSTKNDLDGGPRASKIGNSAEWDSETVRNASMDGFSCCLVLVMEDSPDLSKYGEYLLRAVETGVRRTFTCISGAQTAERVKRYLASQGQGQEDSSHMERQELFAEAIKFNLLGIKDTVATEIDADHQTKEMELAGARSKDLIRYIPPVTIPTGSTPGDGTGNATPTNEWEPPPAPPPTEQSAQKKEEKTKAPGKKSHQVGHKDKAAPPQPGPPATEEESSPTVDANASKTKPSFSNQKIGVKTRMRKRGEVPLPEFEVIDDSPPKGPRSYVLLQGFYNPILIEELGKIGVKVDGILLMTDAKVNRYNFSIIDVEDSIPGTFRPRNVLPQYLKALERLSQNPETKNSEVTQFWSKLSDMYNNAPVDSTFHDIALMNFPLPDPQRINLESSDGITYYISKVYDEVATRIYEMLVLEEWFSEFTSAADVTKIMPLEPTLPHDIYDQIVGQIPSECISVPIILEAVVQQVAYSLEKEAGNPVPEPCYDEDDTSGIVTGKRSFGTTNWGLPSDKSSHESGKGDGSDHQIPPETADGSNSVSSTNTVFKIPMYIKAGDFASIRSCHLNESIAAKIASCQLSGDIRNIQGFLWQKVPEFNRGLYMKLLANLNHFMFFLPPDMIQFEDMFYILHLIMSAGVEVHLQKQANEQRKTKSETMMNSLKSTDVIEDDGVYSQSRPGTGVKFPGTNVSTDHNYLAVNEKAGVNFLITPNSSHELTVSSFGQSQKSSGMDHAARSKSILETFAKQVEQTTPVQSDNESERGSQMKKKKKRRSRKHGELDVNKAARVTTVGAIQSAAKYAQSQKDTTDKTETEMLEKRKKNKKSKKGRSKDDGVTPENAGRSSKDEEGTKKTSVPTGGDGGDVRANRAVNIDDQNIGILGDLANEALGEKKSGFASMNYPSKDTKRFIACEEQWFEDINDTSVIQALLECPALLAINESGALDLSKWIEKYLLSAGMDVGPGDSVLLGDLKNWNYVEELVPIQTVQMLNKCSQEYLSMQRMYCPFYDTILFIFNNPVPTELTAESQFYFRLKTLPGLQHFLEYTMDDQNVLRWIEQLDSSKRLEVSEATSINNLLNIIPEEQWLMVPSIKYQIMVANQRALSGAFSTGSMGNKYYGQIGSYSKTASLPGSLASTKSFVMSPGLTVGTNGSPEEEGDTRRSDTVGSAVPELPTTQPTNTDETKSNRRSKDSRSPVPPSTKGSSKPANSEKTNKTMKTDKQSQAASQQTKSGAGGGGDTAVTTAQNASESVLGEMSTAPPDHENEHDSVRIPKEKDLVKSTLNFTCYDLGKRVAVVGNDTFFLFPMDGTVIRYDISTIEPEFRMMQLTITKNEHQTFFYPYYIPHDYDLSAEDYVVCPYFHMVLSNGTIFAFQDLRAEEAAPYLKMNLGKKAPQQSQLFSFEKVLFGKEVEQKINETKAASPVNAGDEEGDEGEEEEEERGGSAGSHASLGSKGSAGGKKKKSGESGLKKKGKEKGGGDGKDEEGQSLGKKKGKGAKGKGGKKGAEKEKPPETPAADKKKDKKGKKDKKVKGKAEADNPEQEENEELQPSASNTAAEMSTAEGEDNVKGDESEMGQMATEMIDGVPVPPPTSEVDNGAAGGDGEWMYPSSENSDDEAEAAESQKRKLFFAPPWDDAVKVIQPLVHAFNVTLPSGLMATVEDLKGPPLLRIVKQCYVGHGSAKSNIEGSRYYTMDGTVIKFMLNGGIQILTARGVTTNIDELAANSKREGDVSSAFGTASIVKIFNGEVILPNGNMWQVINGRKVAQPPIYVFTTGPLAGGEVFRRRQDGVVYLYRYDGTVITHYPDGTRFTTRMVIMEKNIPPPPTPKVKTPQPGNSQTEVTAEPSRANVRQDSAENEEQEEEEEDEEGEEETQEAEKIIQPEVIQIEDDDEEFSDWVFVGLKYMIEHPNYSTVLFNTLSGNVHLKLPNGEWVRVFADGNIRVSTEDQYSLDVDDNRALLSYPPCSTGKDSLPNLTSVRLWHAAPPGSKKVEVEPVESTLQVPVEEDAGGLLAPPEEPARRDSQNLTLLDPEGEHEHKDHPTGKKKSKAHHGKNIHPKVKAREGAKKSRATRLSNALISKRSISGVDTKDLPKESVPPSEDVSRRVSTTLQEESIPTNEIPMLTQEPSTSQFNMQQPNPTVEVSRPSLREKGDTLSEFLKFNDETTFCKSVDSWDNRFLMNVYGGSVVDKMERQEGSGDMSKQQLIDALSEHSQLPKAFISGILKNTSSVNLDSAARRLNSMRKSYHDSCTGGLPSTKIFVVKRDLTGFQYLQKSQVNEEITKAHGSRESMVMVDPIPRRNPRKFITIMRPVEEIDEPHGMWTRPYIEPIFRPRGVTNKHLRVATPNDLRWFGYILNSAHAKRPKFVPEPREVYKEKRSLERMQSMQTQMPLRSSSDSNQVTRGGSDGMMQMTEEPSVDYSEAGAKPTAEPSSPKVRISDEEEGYSGEEEGTDEDEEGEEVDLGKKRSTPLKDKTGSGGLDDDKKKKKKDKKEKDEKKEKGKGKGKDKKGKGKTESQSHVNTDDDDEGEEEDHTDEGMEEEEEEEFDSLESRRPSRKGSMSIRTAKPKLQDLEPEIEEYPTNVEDIKGIYNLERERRASGLPRIWAKEHSLPCNTKKAVVVRAFVEIPQVDENMQRALLAASMSYADTCRTESAIFKTYKTEDPRSAEEKKKQTEYKQQLIEENIDEMHVLEQKPGPVLRFHF